MRRRRRVIALAYDRLCTFEFGVVVEIFGLPRPEIRGPWYRFEVCALDSGPLHATGGVTMRARPGLRTLRRADTIVIPGWRDPAERPPERLLREIRAAHARGARLVTICSGVFVLAAAGVLDGRRATTHWRYVERLAAAYPRIRVEADVLFVQDANVFTSAGSAAGIDLGLHIVRLDHGAAIANTVARRLVVAPQRDGGQAQFIPAPVRPEGAKSLAGLLAWAERRLGEDLSVKRLAGRAAMSPRTFARRFVEETGTTPHRWLTHQRVLAAQQRLETTREPVDRVAEAVGFGGGATLRLQFARALRTTPTAYRRRFTRLPARSS